MEAVYNNNELVWRLVRTDAIGPMSEHRFELDENWVGIAMNKKGGASHRIADADSGLT